MEEAEVAGVVVWRGTEATGSPSSPGPSCPDLSPWVSIWEPNWVFSPGAAQDVVTYALENAEPKNVRLCHQCADLVDFGDLEESSVDGPDGTLWDYEAERTERRDKAAERAAKAAVVAFRAALAEHFERDASSPTAGPGGRAVALAIAQTIRDFQPTS